jgi:RNA polymerase sigma-70 factor, ECF subfamily
VNATTEWDLIARCRAGSAAAYEPLVRQYEARGLALAGTLLGDADDAQDAVQDAFIKAYRSLNRLAEGSDFGPWFRSILRNLCLDRLRAAPRRARVAWDDAAVDRAAWTEPAGPVAIASERRIARMRAALERLSVEHRDVLVLKEVEGMSYAEIAQLTGTPAGTVGSRLYHARAALKKILEGQA